MTQLTEKISGNQASILSTTSTAFAGIIVVYIWQYAGYIMLIYITGLTQVPKDVLEASQIDGASRIATLFKIKIPMIASTITICTFLTLTSADKHGIDKWFRLCCKLHGKLPYKWYSDAGIKYL